MKKFIATTSINPTPENTAYSDFVKDHSDWTLVIAGDIQTNDAAYRKFVEGKNAVYLSYKDQEEIDLFLHIILGEKTDTRRMFSIIYSYIHGADIIALVDDDNYPTKDWGKDLDKRTPCALFDNPSKVIDPISVAKDNYVSNVWHRGFPLQYLSTRKNTIKRTENYLFSPLVVADLWYGEPDTDAICRLMGTTNNIFNDLEEYQVPFTTSIFAPFNSQNVFLYRKAVPNYFLFPSLGRMSDIWIAYYFESLYENPVVLYRKPSVIQKRNEHSIISDFSKETQGYLLTQKLIESLIENPASFADFVTEDEWAAFSYYKGFLAAGGNNVQKDFSHRK